MGGGTELGREAGSRVKWLLLSSCQERTRKQVPPASPGEGVVPTADFSRCLLLQLVPRHTAATNFSYLCCY